ncbi:DUF1499 domain-containing protein [Thalassotalea piscium]
MNLKKITDICKLTVIPLLLGFPVAIIAYRMQLWDMRTSFSLIKFSGYASAVVLGLVLLLGIFAIFKKQRNVAKSCSIIALLLAIPVVGLSLQASKAKSLPFLHQVTTDTVNLPKFQKVIALRGENSNPLKYDSEKLAPLQLAAYPQLQPIISNLDTKKAFAKAITTANKLGWEIVAMNQTDGIIEAVDTTLLWGFKDDVVIRIEATESGSKIDLRSISRVGGTDLGANAARITKFISTF